MKPKLSVASLPRLSLTSRFKVSVLQFLTRVFGSRNERTVRGYRGLATQAGKFEAALEALADEALAAKTVEFRERLKGGATVDDLLPEA
ncbi:MAG: hypothetical protein ABI645_10410, partial [Pseudomonadota bacterium]